MSKGERILQIAKQLFLEKGYANVSVSDITESLGISKGSFYTYFPSKTEMVLQIIEEKKCLTKKRYQKIRKESSSFEESIRKFLFQRFQSNREHSEVELVVINLMKHWEILEESLQTALLDYEKKTIIFWEEELVCYQDELSVAEEERKDYALLLTKMLQGFLLSNLFISEEPHRFIKNVEEVLEKIEDGSLEKKINFLIKNIIKMLKG